MTATDELRRLLDERGVEHDDSFGATEFHGEGDSVVVALNSKSRNAVLYVNAYLTPEQAVDATLGSDLKAENAKLRELCGELYRELYAAIDEYWPASYLGDLEPGDVFPRYDELIELGVDV